MENSLAADEVQSRGQSLSAEMVQRLSHMASDHNLEIVVAEPGLLTQQQGSVELRAHLKLRGSYAGFVSLLDEFARSGRLWQLERFSIVPSGLAATTSRYGSRVASSPAPGARRESRRLGHPRPDRRGAAVRLRVRADVRRPARQWRVGRPRAHGDQGVCRRELRTRRHPRNAAAAADRPHARSVRAGQRPAPGSDDARGSQAGRSSPPALPVLTAIVWQEGSPTAVVRWQGQEYSKQKGGVFDDFQVVDIGRESVTLLRGSETIVLKHRKQGD